MKPEVPTFYIYNFTLFIHTCTYYTELEPKFQTLSTLPTRLERWDPHQWSNFRDHSRAATGKDGRASPGCWKEEAEERCSPWKWCRRSRLGEWTQSPGGGGSVEGGRSAESRSEIPFAARVRAPPCTRVGPTHCARTPGAALRPRTSPAPGAPWEMMFQGAVRVGCGLPLGLGFKK